MTPRLVGAVAASLIVLSLTACGGGSASGADAAHTKACRGYALLSGGSGPQASKAVLHAAENGTFDGDRLHRLLDPVVSASLRAGLVDGLSDKDYVVFANLHSAAIAALGPVDDSQAFDNGMVTGLSKAVAAEAETCG